MGYPRGPWGVPPGVPPAHPVAIASQGKGLSKIFFCPMYIVRSPPESARVETDFWRTLKVRLRSAGVRPSRADSGGLGRTRARAGVRPPSLHFPPRDTAPSLSKCKIFTHPISMSMKKAKSTPFAQGVVCIIFLNEIAGNIQVYNIITFIHSALIRL